METEDFHEVVVAKAKCQMLTAVALHAPVFWIPLPDSQAFVPDAPGKLGWSPPGPLPSRWRRYASMTKLSSTISIPSKGAPAWQWTCSWVPLLLSATLLLHEPQSCPHHRLRNAINYTVYRIQRHIQAPVLEVIWASKEPRTTWQPKPWNYVLAVLFWLC